jgi:F-type H+-transporting ATPase subunit k
MATLGTTFFGSWLALRGGPKEEQQGPPLNAKSKEEESFIKYAYPRIYNSV